MTDPDRRIEYLDWLRALAVSLVVFGHSARNLAPGGAIGVSVFFVLSGYLIASILLRDGMLRPLNIGKFILRRIARIWPMYAAVIFFMIVVTRWTNPAMNEAFTRNALDLLTFQGLIGEWVGLTAGVLWTLYVEFWFYVSFPIFLFAAVHLRAVWPLLCIGIAASIYAKFAGYGQLEYLYYDHLLIGAAAAYAQKTQSLPSFIKHPGTTKIAVLTILALGLLLPFWHRNFIWWMQSLLVCCATAVAILAFDKRPPKVSLPALSYIGRISYSAYFIHAILLDLVFKSDDGRPGQIPLFLLLTVVLSSATYRFIEEPINRLAKRILPFRVPTP
ncbi:peptidoglycan/LPS O-acetylase OafA/YrhL [Bradyrhizobium japonicum]|uniref:Peptidoglycan/LPS O-acetylase OafA/YrhL n=1 Tax=Bradyrhizobium japonicum TaxID=375 RepID=A0ABV2RYQ0_BRAJP